MSKSLSDHEPSLARAGWPRRLPVFVGVDSERGLVYETGEGCRSAHSAQFKSFLTSSGGLIPIFFVASILQRSVYAVRRLFGKILTASSPARRRSSCCRFPSHRILALGYLPFADCLPISGQAEHFLTYWNLPSDVS